MKKLLALVLALVMTLGLATVGANAAFPDADEISYDEAVGVLNLVGVLQGDEKGNFNPTDTLNRDAAAKIVAYLALGETIAESLTAKQVFDDVPASHWAAKYIAYCADAGYIAGDGTGNFLPSQPLTGQAFGKMLLTVLGYDAEKEGLVGANWAANVDKLLDTTAIGEEVEKATNTVLTREEAAAYAFGALKANVVEYPNPGVSVSTGDVNVTVGGGNANNVVYNTPVGTGFDNYPLAGDGIQQLLEKLYKGKLDVVATAAADKDAFGRPVEATKWTYGDDEVVFAKEPLVTYTAAATVAQVTKDVKGYTFGATVMEDGAAGAAIGTVAALQAVLGNGKTVEVYVNPTTKVITDIIIVNQYVAKITRVVKANAATDTKRSIEIDEAAPAATYSLTTEDWQKGDYVLYTRETTNNTIVTIEEAKTVDATTTESSATSVVAGGNTYKYNAAFVAPAWDLTGNTTYTLTLDKQGNIIASAVKAAAAVTDYLYVLSTQYQLGASNLVNSTGDAAKANVLFTDGSAKVIDLAIFKVGGVKTVKKAAAAGTVANWTLATEAQSAINNWFAYTVNDDGQYTLYAVDRDYATVLNVPTAGATTLTANAIQQLATNDDNNANKYTSSDMKLVKFDTEYVRTESTGLVSSALALPAGNVLLTYTNDATKLSAIYTLGFTPAAATTTYAYALEAGNNVSGGQKWTFAIEGKSEVYTITAGTLANVAAGNIVTLTEAGSGLYDASTAVAPTAAGAVTFVDGSQFVIGGTTYTKTSSCVTYDVDEDNTENLGEAASFGVGDTVTVICTGGDVSKTVAIWVTDHAE